MGKFAQTKRVRIGSDSNAGSNMAKSEPSAKRPKSKEETVEEMKRIWNKFRHAESSKSAREKMIGKILFHVKGHMMEYSQQRVCSHILQDSVRLGTKKQIDTLFEEVKEHLLELTKGEYSKFLVMKFIRHGTKEQKIAILGSYKGHINALVKHARASEPLDLAFREVADSEARARVIEELYGPEFVVAQSKDKPTLAQVVSDHPEKKAKILKNLETILVQCLDKNLSKLHIVQTILLEFYRNCDSVDLVSDLARSMRDHVLTLCDGSDGVRAACYAVGLANARDRKHVLKGVKEHADKMAKDRLAHILLLKLLECTDDTESVFKYLLKPLSLDFDTLVQDPIATKLLLLLLSAEVKQLYLGHASEVIAEAAWPEDKRDGKPGKEAKQQYPGETKKTLGERMKALRRAIEEKLAEAVVFHCGDLLKGKPGIYLIVESILAMEEESSLKVRTALLLEVKKSLKKDEDSLLFDDVAHRGLRILCEKDDRFSKSLYKVIKEDLDELCTRRAGFVVAALVRSSSTKAKMVEFLKPRVANIRKRAENGDVGSKRVAEAFDAVQV